MPFTRPTCSVHAVELMRLLVILLRGVTLLLAAVLLLLVSLSWLIAPAEPTTVPERLLHLFATDDIVRRTAIFSALGLLATAVIFFRIRSKSHAEPDPTPPSPEA